MAIGKMRKTFLSYSRINQDFAVRLAKELKSEGFDVWVDKLDIPLGARWDREVEKALRESEIFMIILTAASVDSENVLDEIGYAIDTSKRFLPVLLEECEVPLRLRRFQYVDFTNKDFDEGVDAAKALLRSLIDQQTIPRETAVPTAQADMGGKISEESDQLAVQKAEADRKAKEEVDRKAREERDRLAAQKAEADRKAKEEADRKAREERDHLAAQKAEADRKAKDEADRKAKEERDRLAAQKAEADRKAKEVTADVSPITNKSKPVPSTSTAQKKSMSKGLLYGIIGTVAVVVLCVTGIGFRAMSGLSSDTPKSQQPTPTENLVEQALLSQSAAKEPTITSKPAATRTPTKIPTKTPTKAATRTPTKTSTKTPTSKPIFDIVGAYDVYSVCGEYTTSGSAEIKKASGISYDIVFHYPFGDDSGTGEWDGEKYKVWYPGRQALQTFILTPDNILRGTYLDGSRGCSWSDDLVKRK